MYGTVLQLVKTTIWIRHVGHDLTYVTDSLRLWGLLNTQAILLIFVSINCSLSILRERALFHTIIKTPLL